MNDQSTVLQKTLSCTAAFSCFATPGIVALASAVVTVQVTTTIVVLVAVQELLVETSDHLKQLPCPPSSGHGEDMHDASPFSRSPPRTLRAQGLELLARFRHSCPFS